MSLNEEFFSDAEEIEEFDLEKAREEAKAILNDWTVKSYFTAVFVLDGNKYCTDKDTHFLLTIDDPKKAKIIEEHYKQVMETNKQYGESLSKAKDFEELNEVVQELLEDLEA